MTNESSHTSLLEELAQEFLAARARGEDPSIESYCEKYGELAEQIRDLFRTMELLDDLHSNAQSESGQSRPGPSLDEKSVGGYRVVAEIGRGGMGIVYEAEQQSLGRRVALKVLPGRLAGDKHAQQRFQREARAAAKMHHTNIVPVFEVGQDGDYFFYAMQLIDGQSLDRVIDELQTDASSDRKPLTDVPLELVNRFSETPNPSSTPSHPKPGSSSGSGVGARVRKFHRWVARTGLQVAEALAYAHARGIVHRDVKPSNLLLDSEGVVWITDFGLAKTEEDGLTRTGEYLGTLRYMSPERFKGKCDPRADIYGLGLTMYELLVRRTAFDATDRLELVSLINTSSPARPRSLDRRIPQDLETIVLKAIEPDPRIRYRSAKELASDLQRFLDDVPIRARRASMSERLFRFARRNKSLATSLCCIATLLLAIAVIAIAAWNREAGLRREETHQRQLAELRGIEISRNRDEMVRQRDQITSQRDEITHQLYFAEMTLAGQGFNDRFGADTVKSRLARWSPQQTGVDLRGWEWFYLYSCVHREHFVSEANGRYVWSANFSPDGSRFAAAVNGYGFKIWDTKSGRLVYEKRTGNCRTVAFSPDGSKLATTGFGGAANIWNASDGELLLQLNGHTSREVRCVAWSPDGQRLATGSETIGETHTLRIWDANTGEQIRSLGEASTVSSLAWHPDGSKLAAGRGDKTQIWEVKKEKELARFEKAGGTLCWNADATRLVVFDIIEQAIRVWEWETGVNVAEIKTNSSSTDSIHCRPSTNQVATGHSDGTVRIWDLTEGIEKSVYPGHTGIVRSVRWSQDGQQLVSASLDGTVRLWNLDAEDPNLRIPGTEDAHWVDWNSSSSQLAVDRNSKRLLVWDLASGNSTLVHDGLILQSVTWSPDDGRLAFAGKSNKIRIWDAANGEVKTLYGPKDLWVKSLSWNRDGNQLAAAIEGGDILIFDVQAQKVIRSIPQMKKGIWGKHIDWSPNSSRLAVVWTDGTVSVWDPSTGVNIWRSERHDETVFACRWSPDGAKLATSHDGLVTIWDGSSGAVCQKVDLIQEQFFDVDWSPDAARLATASGSSVTVWDVNSWHVAQRIPHWSRSVRWSPDGNRLAASGNVGRIFDATMGYRESAARTASE